MKRISYDTYRYWYRYLDIDKTKSRFDKWLKKGIVEPTDIKMSTDKSMTTYRIHTYLRSLEIDFLFEYNGENVGFVEF